ncbi:MAG: methyltransferase domain-containing protein [Candidatus Omnitrophica bacterium]|nr:methyltransferase domain-containing protein [Candidatus Omnitrophota bacterium]
MREPQMSDLSHVKRIDIGCGLPDQKYPECFGMDVNPKYNPDLLHNCDDGVPFADNQLSFINSDNSLEHVKNPYFVLKECYRCLEPGGTMRLVVPNCQWFPLVLLNLVIDLDWFWHKWMNLSFKKERGIHWTLYTPFLITKVVKDVGFKVESRKGFLYSKEIELFLRK